MSPPTDAEHAATMQAKYYCAKCGLHWGYHVSRRPTHANFDWLDYVRGARPGEILAMLKCLRYPGYYVKGGLP